MRQELDRHCEPVLARVRHGVGRDMLGSVCCFVHGSASALAFLRHAFGGSKPDGKVFAHGLRVLNPKRQGSIYYCNEGQRWNTAHWQIHATADPRWSVSDHVSEAVAFQPERVDELLSIQARSDQLRRCEYTGVNTPGELPGNLLFTQ